MAGKVVKVITASVFDDAGRETLAPGDQVPYDTVLPPDVRYRLEEIAVPDEPAAGEPPPSGGRRHVTVNPEPAAGRGAAHK